MSDPTRLYGLTALVLNAGDGIGEAIARTLARHGAEVVAVAGANSGAERQYETVAGVTGLDAGLTAVDAMAGMVERATAILGHIDIVVNDFPVQPDAPQQAVDAGLESILQTRAGLMTAVRRAVLPQLKESPQGRIINIGLPRSCFAIDGESAYAHAEADLASLTRELAAETGEFGVSVNYIQPGAIMTPAARAVFRKDQALRDYCISASAARRLGEPLDVAKVALFFASADSMFVSGTGVAVDGGPTRAT
ncbi:MAG: SDR family oxidoreductase [Gammaproteobacteria bacterium]|nr:SDR family oxidoreductase [Gammaproteobacteria bacterium]